MADLPTVDVNLFVYNGAETVAAAIDSVQAQTWPNIRLTLIDDGSTDDTLDILRDRVARNSAIRLKRNRVNGGALGSFQRAFWFGDADYVMPKSGDDVIAPDFVERTMTVLLENPDCAMCHAGGLVFTGVDTMQGAYPVEHRLHAVGPDRLMRARHVMERYTSSPSFWGVYRRAAVDLLSPISRRAGWDHVLLAELALAGEIRHVPDLLYWRRDGGKPVRDLARAATAQAQAGLPLDDVLAEQRWRTPLITTAYAHVEAFAAARLPLGERLALMREAPVIFRARWLPLLREEACALAATLPDLLAQIRGAEPTVALWLARCIGEVVQAAAAIVPESEPAMFQMEALALAADALRRRH